MKRKIAQLLTIALFTSNVLQACLNTISNNTKNTYKIVEITKENADIKQQVYLPDACLNEDSPENHTHTLLPDDECSFGGHYVPTFAIFKQYPDKKWRNVLVVKQLRCGPRGPENKYLLLTDLLNRDLPGDYSDVYKFTLKVEPKELADESVNTEALTSVANQYQVILNLIDDLTQKVQELMSKQLREERKLQPAKEQVEPSENNDDEEQTIGEAEDGAPCDKCMLPAAA